MKLQTNVIIQILSTISQVANLSLDIVPSKYKPVVTGLISIVQVVTGVMAHHSNLDGSPVSK